MSLTEKLQIEIEQIRGQRHQLLIMSCVSKNEELVLNQIEDIGIPAYNRSLELSRHMRELPMHKRPKEVSRFLRQLINKSKSEVICFKKIEYIFDSELQQDPIRLFESLSGNKVVIVIWPGNLDGTTFTYAVPGHPEYTTKQVSEEHIVIL